MDRYAESGFVMSFLRGIGLPELLIILTIVLLIFGTTRLPKLAGSMGKAVREFRKATDSGGRPPVRGRKGSARGSKQRP